MHGFYSEVELTAEVMGLAHSCEARRLRSLEHMATVRGAAATGSHPATTARMFCRGHKSKDFTRLNASFSGKKQGGVEGRWGREHSGRHIDK